MKSRRDSDSAPAAEVRHWQTSLSELDQGITPVTPPEAVWQRIERGLPAEKTRVSTARPPAGGCDQYAASQSADTGH